MTLALGLCYWLAIGVGDFFGGYLARRSAAFTGVITFLLVGAVTAAGLSLVIESALRWDDVGFALVFLHHGIAVASGVLTGLGVVAFVGGAQRGRGVVLGGVVLIGVG